jgi:nitrogen fixation protein NifU and related proteins
VSDDLRELYQEVILDHGRRPRNLREIPGASRKAEGYNPLCGDRATVYVEVDGDVVKDASFVGRGCSISTASASMMTEAVKGKTLKEAEALFESFHALVTGGPAPDGGPDIGKLAVFSGVSEFPARVKCASLAWHTLRSALHGEAAPVTTESGAE